MTKVTLTRGICGPAVHFCVRRLHFTLLFCRGRPNIPQAGRKNHEIEADLLTLSILQQTKRIRKISHYPPLKCPVHDVQWNLYQADPILSGLSLLCGHQLESLSFLLTFTNPFCCTKPAISWHFKGFLLLKVLTIVRQYRIKTWLFQIDTLTDWTFCY